MPSAKSKTRAESYLANAIKLESLPAITPFAFFCKLQTMYGEGKNLYLKHNSPNSADYKRFIKQLYKSGSIRYDTDYGTRLIRVLDVSEQSPEDIVCLADSLCYISHLSAMQRWGLTDRSPKSLMFTRPDRKTATATYAEIMEQSSYPLPPKHLRLHHIVHPDTVRRTSIQVFESKNTGAYAKIPGTNTQVATIGQTFLDMLQHPSRCGGMPHVLDVFDEHAVRWSNEIINAVETCNSSLVKSRAGYIMEERLGVSDNIIDSWKMFSQRGGSRKLDPGKDYQPIYSDTWMISINV